MAVAPASSNTAYYSTRDDINNFRVKVCLRELSSSELLSASPRAAQAAQQAGTKQRPQFSETLTVSWQQSVPRPSGPDEGTAAGKQRTKRRIFTYTHKDNIKHELLDSSATSSRLPDRECPVPGRSGAGSDETDAGDILLPRGVRQCQSYFIMADLRPDDGDAGATSGNCTVLLCCLRYDASGELTVTPDFNHAGIEPYRIRGPGNAHYEYTVELASTPPPPPSPARAAPRLTADDWSSDEEEDEGALQLTVTGELTRLTQCTVSGDVYLSYAVHLPAGWWAGRNTECEGVSAVCRPHGSVWSTTRSYVYSTPLSFTLYTHGSGNGWPVLLAGAFAVDGEGGERDVGWTAVDLTPLASGGDVRSAPLWSPAPLSPTSALQQTFLPGCRLLPPASYLAPYTPRLQVSRVSRLGLVATTTGVLEYRLHTLLRSSLRLPHPGEMVSQLPGPRLATKKALAALRKSRRKLRQVTAGLSVP